MNEAKVRQVNHHWTIDYGDRFDVRQFASQEGAQLYADGYNAALSHATRPDDAVRWAGKLQPDKTILEEAIGLADGERAAAYGPASDDALRWATIFAVLTGFDIKPEHYALSMIATKLSRLSQAPGVWHRDSVVDIAGWARVHEKIHDGR